MSVRVNGINVSIEGVNEYALVNWLDHATLHLYFDTGVSLFLDEKNVEWFIDQLIAARRKRPAPPEQLPLPFPPKDAA